MQWRDSYKRCSVGYLMELRPEFAKLKKDALCWQFTVLTAYYHELKRQSQLNHKGVPKQKLHSIFNHIISATKTLQQYKVNINRDMQMHIQPSKVLSITYS